jgi:hypothetical protein
LDTQIRLIPQSIHIHPFDVFALDTQPVRLIPQRFVSIPLTYSLWIRSQYATDMLDTAVIRFHPFDVFALDSLWIRNRYAWYRCNSHPDWITALPWLDLHRLLTTTVAQASLNKCITLVCGKAIGHITAPTITICTYSLGSIASSAILSWLLLLVSWFPMPDNPLHNNHQQQQSYAIFHNDATYISLCSQGVLYFGAEYGVKHANSHEVLMCLPWTLVAMWLQRCSCQLSSLNKSATLVLGNGNGYTSAIMINTTNTLYGYSLGFIAFPTILSSLLPCTSLYSVAEHGSCNNHQQQQWCVINLVFITYISLLLPTSALKC